MQQRRHYQPHTDFPIRSAKKQLFPIFRSFSTNLLFLHHHSASNHFDLKIPRNCWSSRERKRKRVEKQQWWEILFYLYDTGVLSFQVFSLGNGYPFLDVSTLTNVKKTPGCEKSIQGSGKCWEPLHCILSLPFSVLYQKCATLLIRTISSSKFKQQSNSLMAKRSNTSWTKFRF